MEMRRRGFMGLVLGAGAAVAAPVLAMLEGLLPTRYVEAVRPALPAAPFRKPEGAGAGKPARWAG